ncbi:hypothetical protein BT69DRAFT_1300421, partial [Atractiella rhizophila]
MVTNFELQKRQAPLPDKEGVAAFCVSVSSIDHNTMSNQIETYRLFFQLVQPDPQTNRIVGTASSVTISSGQLVEDLEKEIRANIRERHPAMCSLDDFVLWALQPMLPSKEQAFLKTIKFPSERLKQLDPTFPLSDYWEKPPANRHLHVVVELAWHHHGSLDQYQSRARIKALTKGSFSPHSLLEQNHIFQVAVPPTRPPNYQEDPNLATLRQAKATLAQQFQLPPDPDAATLAIGTSLQNDFFGGTVKKGRRATKAELSHYHHVSAVEVPMERFLDNKQAYFNWTYLMPVASELSRQRYGLIK